MPSKCRFDQWLGGETEQTKGKLSGCSAYADRGDRAGLPDPGVASPAARRARRRGHRARSPDARGRDREPDHRTAGVTALGSRRRRAGGRRGELAVPRRDVARAERLPDKCTIQLKAGDVLWMLTPGGGGWGTVSGGLNE
ncbi:MAG: hydantoinase B/oxoprolinase family protein [Actinobacteria bacterium]|nr:hydantoinase B/oxoprolinase family protein [Actinomycetota bacterium]